MDQKQQTSPQHLLCAGTELGSLESSLYVFYEDQWVPPSSEETSSFLHSTTTMGLLCGTRGAIKIPHWFVPCERQS